MKGVIFAELIRWVEEAFSAEIADEMIMVANPDNRGSYTTVGNYPHEEALRMIGALSEIADTPVPELAKTYGFWLSRRFIELYPEMFEDYSDVRSFLRDIDAHHHREVKKLYPDARTPSVLAVVDGEELLVSYASHRPLADVAFGLIQGYIDYYDEQLEVIRDANTVGPHAARFHIRDRVPPVETDI